jgi:hypothetical protein
MRTISRGHDRPHQRIARYVVPELTAQGTASTAVVAFIRGRGQ